MLGSPGVSVFERKSEKAGLRSGIGSASITGDGGDDTLCALLGYANLA